MSPGIGLTGPLVALGAFGVLYLPVLSRFLPEPGWFRLPFSPQVFFLVSAALILRIRNVPLSGIGLSKTRVGRNAAVGILLGFLPVVVVLLGGALLTQVDSIHPFLKRPIFGGPPLANRIRAHDLATLLLLAPVCEEFFFRGVLLRALRESYPGWLAVAASAFIFMGAHGQLAPGPLTLGLINGVIVLRTGSIVPGIVFHSIANAYGPVMIFWFPNLYEYLRFLYR